MLDSSPIQAPAAPRKSLKRSASLASLPSPPPSVQQPKKRHSGPREGSDLESVSEDEEGEDNVTGFNKFAAQKLLFPPGPSVARSSLVESDNPFLVREKDTSVAEQLALDSSTSPTAQPKRSASPLPSSKELISRVVPKSPRTPPPKEKSFARHLPISDEEDNPFLGRTPPRRRRAKSPQDISQRPTMTYVFKGVKTIVPNPYYNLPDSAFERSRLPMSHPDYSPPPIVKPKLLFPEACSTPKCGSDDDDDEEEEAENSSQGEQPRTPENKTKKSEVQLSKVFVDDMGIPLPDSGPEGIRGSMMDAEEVGRMAVGPIRNRH